MKNWEKEFKQKFVKGYGNGLVDWKYPEEGNVIDFIQTILDKQKEEIKEIIGDKLDELMKNPGEEDQIALDTLEDILEELNK